MASARESPLKDALVLILEDEFFIADDLARAVREVGGEPVGPVGTVRRAEELIAQKQPDAAIVDLNLRGEMASDFVERLAKTQVRCVIVSGYGGDGLPEPLTRLRRLEKPVDVSAVMAALEEELTRVA